MKVSQKGQSLVEYAVILGILALLVWCLAAALQLPNRISDERALTRIADMEEVQVSDIEVLYSTDNSPWTGDTHDVSYDIEVNGVRMTARCNVTSWFSDMVCRTYNGVD